MPGLELSTRGGGCHCARRLRAGVHDRHESNGKAVCTCCDDGPVRGNGSHLENSSDLSA